MAKKETPSDHTADLRKKAEKILRKKADPPQKKLETMQPDEMMQTLHELRIHQTELEIQNEELRLTQEELVAARARYFDLYDMAPVGYFTVSEKRMILEANLTAATLLGVRKVDLVGLPLGRFIPKEEQDSYYLRSKLLFDTGAPQVCEMRMVKKDGTTLWAHLEATVLSGNAGASVCRLAVIDITARKRGEVALRESEERFRKLFEQHTAVKLIIDPDTGNIMDANDAAAQFYGWPIEELKGMRISQINTLSPEAVKTEMENAASSKRNKFEFRHQRADGSIRDVEVFSNKIVIAKKAVLYSIIHDVTESKQAEAAVKKNETKFRLAFENAKDAIIWANSETGVIMDCNTAATELFEKPKGELVGSHQGTLHPPELVEYYRTMFADQTRDLRSGVEAQIVTSTGAIRTVTINVSNTEFEGRKIIQGIFRDISDRKQAEAALQEAHDALEQRVVERTEEIKRQSSLISSLLDSIPDIIFFKDIHGVYLGCNPPFAEFVGKPREEIIGRTDYDLFDKEVADIFREHDKRMLETRKPRHNEEWITYPDARKILIDTMKTPYWGADGTLIGVLGISRDITERKRAVDALQLSMQAAEAANRAKSAFLANMSHEIRTPMSGVIGMTALLLETPLTDKQRGYAEKIKASSKSLLTVLNDILDFSKIEAGKLTLESIPFSMAEVIGNVVNIFGSQAAEKGILLHTVIDPELPAALLGDPQRLIQVINNLMGNAVKFTKAGDIQLTAKGKRQTEASIELEISVQDTGIGMTEEELSRIFTAFSQVDTSTTRRFGGTGLGLAISRQLIELMGGTIQVKSTPGKGSVFTFVISLPISLGVEGADLLWRSETPRGQFTGVRALVAEDHEINREIIIELLRQAGIEADIAANGREAVEMVRTQDYDVVFMDIQMPEMDGLTATREIRKLGREGMDRLPILAMTAHALKGDREKSLNAGMNDHLTKPIDRDTLGSALRRWLPREKYTAVAVALTNLATQSDIMSIPSVPGLDMKEGLNRLGGNQNLYLKLLYDFAAGYGETPEQLLQELRMDQREEAMHRIHAIKGVAGNLGGKELAAAAAKLEKAIRASGNGIPFALGEPLRVFIDCHEAMIMATGSILSRQPVVSKAKPQGPPGTEAEMRLLLKRLKKALDKEEPLPCKEILEALLKRSWPVNQEAILAELNHLVNRYRLADALALLDKEFKDIMGSGDGAGGIS